MCDQRGRSRADLVTATLCRCRTPQLTVGSPYDRKLLLHGTCRLRVQVSAVFVGKIEGSAARDCRPRFLWMNVNTARPRPDLHCATEQIPRSLFIFPSIGITHSLTDVSAYNNTHIHSIVYSDLLVGLLSHFQLHHRFCTDQHSSPDNMPKDKSKSTQTREAANTPPEKAGEASNGKSSPCTKTAHEAITWLERPGDPAKIMLLQEMGKLLERQEQMDITLNKIGNSVERGVARV